MDADALALPTLIAAIVSALLAAVAIIVPLVMRQRDRVELEITGIRTRPGRLLFTVRNKGGGTTTLRGLFFVEPGNFPNGGPEPLGPRSETQISRSVVSVAREAPANPTAIYAMDESGRKSKPLVLPDEIRKAIQVSRPT